MVVILSLVQYLFAQVLLSISCLLPKIIERQESRVKHFDFKDCSFHAF